MASGAGIHSDRNRFPLADLLETTKRRHRLLVFAIALLAAVLLVFSYRLLSISGCHCCGHGAVPLELEFLFKQLCHLLARDLFNAAARLKVLLRGCLQLRCKVFVAELFNDEMKKRL